MTTLRHRATWLAAVVLALTLTGCGSSQPKAAASEPATTQATPTPTPTPTVSDTPVVEPSPDTSSTDLAGPASYSSQPSKYTDPAGWTYEFAPTFGVTEAAFDPEFDTSPPGQSKFSLNLTLPDSFGWQLGGDTPGRTPPDTHPDAVVLFYPFRGSFPTGDPSHECYWKSWYNFIEGSSPTQIHAFARKLGLPAEGGLFCNVAADGAVDDRNTVASYTLSEMSTDGDEDAVRHFVSAARQEQPTIVAVFGNWNCLAFYKPDGSVSYSERGGCHIGPS